MIRINSAIFYRKLLVISLVYFFLMVYFSLVVFAQEEKTINTYISKCSKICDGKDNGVHKSIAPKYFEWWFFVGILDNGYTFAATFGITESPCWVRLTIYGPDNEVKNYFKEFELKQVIAKEEKCYLKMGRSYVYEKNGDYYLNFIGDGLRLDVKLKREVGGWRCQHNGLWLVPIPRGRLRGKLWVNERWIPIKGTGYHEHYWHRGRFVSKDLGYEKLYYEVIYTENFALFFFEAIYSPDKSNLFGVIKMRDKVDIPIHNLKFEYLDMAISRDNKDYPQKIRIDLAEIGTIDLKVKKILEESSSYFRILNDAEISLSIDKKEYKEKGICYSEVIYLK